MAFKCFYYDGVSATRHDYEARIETNILTLIDPQRGAKKVFWNLEDIVVIQTPTSGTPGKLSHKAYPDARLVIRSNKDWKTLHDALPRSSHLKEFFSLKWRFMPVYFLLMIICAGLYYFGIPKLIEQSVHLIPKTAEKKIGNQFIKSISEDEDIGLCENKEGVAALNKIIDTLLTSPTGRREDVDIATMTFEMENAFALPGRWILVFDQIIENAKTPEEVAFVIAHEIGHVEERHAMKSYMRSMGLSFLIQVMTGNMSISGTTWSNIFGSVGDLHNSRSGEREADNFALDLFFESGIDPTNATAFFERIKDEEIDFIPSVLSTHPETQERIDHINARIEKEATGEYIELLSDKEWQALRKICVSEEEKVKENP